MVPSCIVAGAREIDPGRDWCVLRLEAELYALEHYSRPHLESPRVTCFGGVSKTVAVSADWSHALESPRKLYTLICWYLASCCFQTILIIK